MIVIVAGLIARDGRVLICQRRRDQDFPLKWEFPGGKIESGEDPGEALRRELAEELGIEAEIGAEVARLPYRYEGRPEILLIFFKVEAFRREVENRVFEQVVWVPPEKLRTYDFLEADLVVLDKLLDGLRLH